MATQAQCFYCFECLSASYEGRNPPSLNTVTALWKEYEASRSSGQQELGLDGLEEASHDDHISNAEAEESEEIEAETELDEDEDTVEDDEKLPTSPSTHSNESSQHPISPRPQIPTISRLQGSNRSSGASTPSTVSTSTSLSASSSNSALTTPASSTTSIPNNFSKTLLQRHRRPAPTSYPLFVTWNTHSTRSNHKSLRGCIGTFDPLPLASGLQTYALTSAFEDTRFSPIPASQLPLLSCAITLLAEFETCATPLDWTVGTHGLRVSFVYRGRRIGATYLPDVAMEQGWSREETLESLMRKAGWDGGSGVGGVRRLLRGGRRDGAEGGAGTKPWDEVASFTVVRYTGLKASAGYSEWREWRDWVEMGDRELS